MGWNDRIEEDGGFSEYLTYLVENGHLEGAALGIAKLVIDKGEEALSPKQKYVFHEHVIKPNTVSECMRCGNDIPWSEMIEAVDSKLCGYCAYQVEKSKDD